MLKLTVALLAVAIAGVAGADELPSLRVDASSKAAFERSLAVFKDTLSPEQLEAFGDALKDIWLAGTQAAEAERRKYRARHYYREIDGLSYGEVVGLATGESAKLQDQPLVAATEASSPRAAVPPRRRPPPRFERSPWEGVPPPPATWQPRGGTPLTGPGGQQ